MSLSARVAVATILAACAAGAPAPPPGATPVPAQPPILVPDTPTPIPAPPPVVPTPLTAARLAPQVGRFLAHQVVDIHNDYAGLPPRQTIGYQSRFTVTVRDSTTPPTGSRDLRRGLIAADSGVPPPPTMASAVRASR
jgi:hypothetical protein